MKEKLAITFVAAVNNKEILQNNLLESPCLRMPRRHQLLVQENYRSASLAYNDAIEKSQNDLIAFVHQDIILPEHWMSDLERALGYLEEDDPKWGVIGSYGETRDDNGRGYIYSSGLGIMGRSFLRPAQVQTLDEIVLILRKSSGLRFDERLPNFHMYGTDICMAAEDSGRKNYAISAFCIHNTSPSLILGRDFYESYRYVKHKWKQRLPIQTTCVRISRFDRHMYRRRIGEFYVRYINRKSFGGSRSSNVKQLLRDVNTMLERNLSLNASPRDFRADNAR
jgi:hypothetical protein